MRNLITLRLIRVELYNGAALNRGNTKTDMNAAAHSEGIFTFVTIITKRSIIEAI